MSAERSIVLAVREALRRAVLTLHAVPDPERRFLAAKSGHWPEIVREVSDAYGYTPERVRRFSPTPHDVSVYLTALAWLEWYRREVDQNWARTFVGWAMGVPLWLLANRSGTSDDTIRRRIYALSEKVAYRYQDQLSRVLKPHDLDRCGECGANQGIHPDNEKSESEPVEPDSRADSIVAWRAPDAVPVDAGPDDPDRVATVRMLERQAERRAKRARV